MKPINAPSQKEGESSREADSTIGMEKASGVGASSERSRRFSMLILEDDPILSSTLEQFVLMKQGCPVVCASVEEARKAVDEESFDLFLLDQALPDGTGSAFFYELRGAGIGAPVIMLTAQPDLAIAVELTRNGLMSYLLKPFRLEELSHLLEQAVAVLPTLDSDPSTDDFVGNTPLSREVRRLVQNAAATPMATVLLTGETGVGKDLTARLIHRLTFTGRKPERPFVSLNCANLQAEMFAAELFGAEKGAYTGAHQLRVGLAEAAGGGTLFLDEIAELPLPLQAKFLQFIEAREFRRLGSSQTLRFQGRIIAATNRVLEDEVKDGRFRADLWYRLDLIPIALPSLRERKADLPFLTEVLLAKIAAKYGRPKPNVSPEQMEALQAYDFPGNVRELRNVLERSLLAAPVQSSWLALDPAWLRRSKIAFSDAVAPPKPQIFRDLTPMEAHEYALIGQVLREEAGGIRRTAARLGMSHQKLLRRLEKWPELRPDR